MWTPIGHRSASLGSGWVRSLGSRCILWHCDKSLSASGVTGRAAESLSRFFNEAWPGPASLTREENSAGHHPVQQWCGIQCCTSIPAANPAYDIIVLFMMYHMIVLWYHYEIMVHIISMISLVWYEQWYHSRTTTIMISSGARFQMVGINPWLQIHSFCQNRAKCDRTPDPTDGLLAVSRWDKTYIMMLQMILIFHDMQLINTLSLASFLLWMPYWESEPNELQFSLKFSLKMILLRICWKKCIYFVAFCLYADHSPWFTTSSHSIH